MKRVLIKMNDDEEITAQCKDIDMAEALYCASVFVVASAKTLGVTQDQFSSIFNDLWSDPEVKDIADKFK